MPIIMQYVGHICSASRDNYPESYRNTSHNRISRVFYFKNYYQTIAFVNLVAWLSHQENHHPDLSVHYQKCIVDYSTHAIGGLSENDFICAAKINEWVLI